MREGGLEAPCSNARKRRYGSYAGGTGGAPDNLVKRGFHAGAPNVLWLADIARFALPGFKRRPSPATGCFDGKAASRRSSPRPGAELAGSAPDDAIAALSEGGRPVRRNDRGRRCRRPGRVERRGSAGIVRSTSKKGRPPDDSACEGFFGRLENGFFCGRDRKDVTFDEFSALLDGCIEFYNEGHVKKVARMDEF